MLANRSAELQQRKRELAASLTSTATEYEQWDPRWGAIRYGSSSECTNIKEAGCGPTSLAIVMNYLYQEDPESLAASGAIEIVSPPETAAYAATHGRVCNSGTAGDTMVTQVHTGWPGFRGIRITLKEATAQLRSGNLVIFLCKHCTGQKQKGGTRRYGGHFMVLNGVDADGTTYNVLDPGGRETRDIVTISREELQNHTNGFWIIERQ
jgi:Peptidase_C39 like family